ncbi:metal ABC transporter substrate-binding protein [Rhodospirillum rubrum]|uniref:MetQ/NlpA family ABC transporter substrate-binding protein n=1 Tax=Rhodospirillum rubrum TaxID=1085 RepID=UPI001907DBB1|nr:MetQ/NlpA family ABC transporter substrate-binding protein [Rhodospirillum rubrum]MBK1663779.1 metal ABC transporter substrate-binding protein [Rhodospirillum rubrum]MBK1677710.1 metal ABC transporter substrate-binding protein [Rhodospirillum rubrum]
MRFLKTIAAAAILATGFAAPGFADTKIKVGVTPGEHEEVMEQVKALAKDKGLDVEIVTFSDYVLPNQALNDGDLQLNSFQHVPYLENQIKDRGYKLSVVGKNFVTPMGIYSETLKSLDALPEGARFALPNDPTNGGRALLLLQAKGVITLKDGAGLSVTPADVVSNPKKLKFIELDAAQLPRSLPDVDAAAINTNYALDAGLNPTDDAIALESAESPYTNVIVARTQDKDAEWVKAFVAVYQSEPIRKFILDTYKGAVLPVF